MLTLPNFGLLLTLLGVPVLWAVFRYSKSEELGFLGRLALWLLAGIVFAISVVRIPDWRSQIGISLPTWSTLSGAAVGVCAMLASWPVVHFVQQRFGTPVEQTALFKKAANLPFAYRSFIVLTAGVTEEVLYRAYAIGVGKSLLGNLQLAAMLSLGIFVVLHLRWGLSHLLSVFWAGAVLTMMFIVTNDLVSCILAHLAVDAVGLLFAPWMMSMKDRRASTAASGA